MNGPARLPSVSFHTNRYFMTSWLAFKRKFSLGYGIDYLDLNNWTPEQRRRLKKSYELTYLENLLADHEKYVQEEYNSQKEAKVFDEDLKKVTAPTLIIYGTIDAFVVPEHAKQYQAAIANSK